jgi:hypothetical protein
MPTHPATRSRLVKALPIEPPPVARFAFRESPTPASGFQASNRDEPMELAFLRQFLAQGSSQSPPQRTAAVAANNSGIRTRRRKVRNVNPLVRLLGTVISGLLGLLVAYGLSCLASHNSDSKKDQKGSPAVGLQVRAAAPH